MDTKEAIERLKNAFYDWINSDSFIKFSKFMSMFRNYSFFNTLLIFLQKPDASLVAGFSTWKNMKRFVKKGEHGIMIYAPNVKKQIVEEGDQTIEKFYVTGFRKVYVFDISQTEGEPVPQTPEIVIKDEFEGFQKLRQTVEAMGYTVKEYESQFGEHGFTKKGEKVIYLDRSATTGQKASTLVHEWAHQQFGTELERKDEEIVVQTASYFIMATLGLDTSWYTAQYIQSWSQEKDWEQITHFLTLADSLRKKFFGESTWANAA